MGVRLQVAFVSYCRFTHLTSVVNQSGKREMHTSREHECDSSQEKERETGALWIKWYVISRF
jgi:hypothetical protein